MIVYDIDKTWSADLVYVDNITEYNNAFKFLWLQLVACHVIYCTAVEIKTEINEIKENSAAEAIKQTIRQNS